MTAEKASPIITRLLLLAPVGLVVYFAFNAGGFFPRQVAIAAILSAQVFVLYVSLAGNPFSRLGWPAAVAISAMALFALWVLGSQLWSDSPARSLLEFDRAMLYLLLLAVFSFLGGRPDRLRFAVRAFAIVMAGVAICSLITRLAPDLWPTQTNFQNNRLSFPLTYWNALGIFSAFALILCFHLTSSEREPRPLRVLTAAAIPAVATTLFFCFSRGPIYAAAVGLVAYMLVGRPRALLSGLVATVPTTVIAIVVAYHADLLATPNPTTPAAVHQGHHVAAVLAVCVVAAAALRGGLLLLDQRREHTLPELLPAMARRGLVVAGALLAVAGVVVALESGEVDRAAHAISSDKITSQTDFRTRLTQLTANGRTDQYRAALKGFDTSPLHGTGAGTFNLSWQQYRHLNFHIIDAHSLYLETMSEMGIVGLVLILTVVLTLLGTALARARPPDRAIYGAVFGAGLAWALHAGVDWDWEMPATTVPFIVLAGLALGTPRPVSDRAPSADTRLALSLGGVLCLVVPILIIGSQSRLNDGLFAYRTTGCKTAMTGAADSLNWLAVRTEAYQVMGYCDLRLGQPVAALQAMRKAHSYDPHNWETDAGLAVAQAANGQDPRPAIGRAVVRAPDIAVLRTLRRQLDGRRRQSWIDAADTAHLALVDSGELSIQSPD